MGQFDSVTTENRTIAVSAARTATFTSDLQNNDKARGIMVVLDVTATTAAVNEVQEVVVDATGGTFTLTFDGQVTSALAFDAPTATVQTALRALSTIGGTAVDVTGSASNYTVTFVSTLAAQNVATMISDPALLTGGAQTATVSTSTPGSAASSLVLTVKGADTTSGQSVTLLTGAAVTSISTNTYRLYPGLTAVANATVSDVLPKTFSVRVTAGNVSSTTYSVGAVLLA